MFCASYEPCVLQETGNSCGQLIHYLSGSKPYKCRSIRIQDLTQVKRTHAVRAAIARIYPGSFPKKSAVEFSPAFVLLGEPRPECDWMKAWPSNPFLRKRV